MSSKSSNQFPDKKHRRTYSNNLEQVKGLNGNIRHRRTLSNTASDFSSILAISPPPNLGVIEEIPSPAIIRPKVQIEEEPLTPDSLNSPQFTETRNEFLSNLDFALSYFQGKRKFQPPPTVENSELAELKTFLENLQERQAEIENIRSMLISEYSYLKQAIEQHTAQRVKYEKQITSLKSYSNELEQALRATEEKLKFEKKRNNNIKAVLSSQSPDTILKASNLLLDDSIEEKPVNIITLTNNDKIRSSQIKSRQTHKRSDSGRAYKFKGFS
jgi:hypothetical protein